MTHHEMPATKFGRLAAQDPRFVLDLRMGRTPRAATEARIKRWMADYAASLNASPQLSAFGAIETKDYSNAV